MTTTPPPPSDGPEPPADFRPRIPRSLMARVARYAISHYATDRGVRRSLSLNAATAQLLERGLDAADKEGSTDS